MVRNLALNAVRDGQRHVDVDDIQTEVLRDAATAIHHPDTADTYAMHADLGRLAHCLEGLDASRRQCVLHAYLDGCSHSEIAQRLGAPLGTVKAWIRRSLTALRECMA